MWIWILTIGVVLPAVVKCFGKRVGNFFINGEDLKKHDFSNTLFSTDRY